MPTLLTTRTKFLGFKSLAKALGLTADETEQARNRATATTAKFAGECEALQDAHYHRALVRNAFALRVDMIRDSMMVTMDWAGRPAIAAAIQRCATPLPDAGEDAECWNPGLWDLVAPVEVGMKTEPERCAYVVLGLAQYFLTRQEEGLRS